VVAVAVVMEEVVVKAEVVVLVGVAVAVDLVVEPVVRMVLLSPPSTLTTRRHSHPFLDVPSSYIQTLLCSGLEAIKQNRKNTYHHTV